MSVGELDESGKRIRKSIGCFGSIRVFCADPGGREAVVDETSRFHSSTGKKTNEKRAHLCNRLVTPTIGMALQELTNPGTHGG
jgi:hypothetical protein